MQVIINDKIVGYDILSPGSKKTVLYIHGWGANRHSLEALAKSVPNTRAILVDVPGFGESYPPDTAWGLDEFAGWLVEFLDKLKITHIDAIVGHSNGGAIAIKLVASGRLQPAKLVLMGASGIRSREQVRKKTLKALSQSGKIATRILPKKARTKLKSKWYKVIGSEALDTRNMEPSFRKVVAEDMVLEAAMISSSTLLIYGSDDKATPLRYGQIYHEVIEGSKLQVVEGAGHYSFIDKPAVVSDAVKEFLAS